MSWDIFAQDFPADAASVEDIPDDFQPKPIDNRTNVIQKIQAVVPHADFSDPAWGIIEGSKWSIEVSLGINEVCDCITFHVRGEDGAIETLAAILNHLNLRAIDTQTGEFFAGGDEGSDSFHEWRQYRDRVVGEDQ